MPSDSFIDYIKIFCRSGNGGPGSVHFHRDRRNPRGGPDGGDGGRGGHIVLKGDRNLWTLLHLRYRKHILASDGGAGGPSHSTGANGKDMVISVPLGTVARDAETGMIECEITEHEQEVVFLEGGMGGLGNSHFKTATRQAPQYAQPGVPGLEGWKILELKLLADVGLVGFPNAGKSTLLSALSAARPEIGDYPFTTLKPNLGIVSYRGDQSFVMADIPGIIEGAHQGKGLGLRFLRHVERNAVLLFMIPCDSDYIEGDYETLLREITLYNPELLDKPRVVAITKCDLLDDVMRQELLEELTLTPKPVLISAISRYGLTALLDTLWAVLSDQD